MLERNIEENLKHSNSTFLVYPTIKNTLIFCLILAPIAIFWWIFEKYALNIPHWDDFAVRNSIVNFLESDSFLEKIKILFAQHNEHRIFLTRIASLIIYEIKGTLDWKWLMFLGSFCLMGVLFLFYKISKIYNNSLLALVPVSFLIFNAGLFENTFWGMASIQNFGVIFFAFLTFYWLVFSIENQTKIYFYFAIIACFLGVFASSNGIIIPILGLLILLFQQRKQAIFIWIGISLVFFLAYFFNFEPNPEQASKANLYDISLLIKGFVATLGNALDSTVISPEKHLDLSMALGIFLLVFIALFSYQTIFKKYNTSSSNPLLWRGQGEVIFIEQKNNDLFLLACLAFLTITCAGIVYARVSFGFGVLLTSKYKIYSVLILAIFYLIALQSFSGNRKKHFIQLAIFTAIIFNIYTYLADYQSIRYLRHERITDQFKQQYSDKSIATRGISAKLQQAEKAFYDDIIGKILQPSDSVKTNIIITENETSFRLVENKNGEIVDLTSPDAGQYFILKSAENVYLFPTQTIAMNRKAYLSRDFLINNRLPIGSFVAELSKFYIKSGKYQLGKVLVENNTKTITFTTQSIDIQTVTKEKPKQNW